jgi:type IV secretory pathway protease TraF
MDLRVARNRDRRGRALPVCRRVVANAELSLKSLDRPADLDGRYFGPAPASPIVGRAEPLWTSEEP